MPKKETLAEKSWFISDEEGEDADKNAALATLLSSTWNDLSLVRVERIEIGSSRGWKATYRE